MSIFSKFSDTYDMFSSSESENEIESIVKLDTDKKKFNKTFLPSETNSLTSNLSSQTSNISFRFFKKLKRKVKLPKSETLIKNKRSTSPNSSKQSKAKHNLSVSKNVLNNKEQKKIPMNKKITYPEFADLNKEYANIFESSSDSDFPDIKYLKIISKNKEIGASSSSGELKQNKSILNIKNRKHLLNNSFKINNKIPKRNETSMSSNYFNFTQTNIDSVNSQFKNKEIDASSSSGEWKQNKSISNIKNRKHLLNNSFKISNKIPKRDETSTSSSYFNFTQTNIDSVNSEMKNNELNLDDLSSDGSLSDMLYVLKNDCDKNNKFYRELDTNNSFGRMKSVSPKLLPLNISLGIQEEPILQEPSNVSIIVPELFHNVSENERNQTVSKVEIDGPEHTFSSSKHTTINKPKSFSSGSEVHQVQPKLDSFSFIEGSSRLKPDSIKKTRSYRFKNDINETYNMNSEKKNKNVCKKNYFKSSDKTTQTPINSDVFVIKKPSVESKKKRNRYSKSKTTEDNADIGLEYDSNKDNYMVELANGVLVPAFLSTLKPKDVKKLCACGITSSEIPLSWSVSLHDILHQNIYKLRFKGNLPKDKIINVEQYDIVYMVFIVCENYYDDNNIRNTVNNVDDFVCLEYGISKNGIRSDTAHSTYLAVLPNFKVIGYLEVNPIQNAYKLPCDEQSSRETVTVKFGVSKLWVLIKYRNKNVDINLLDNFCKKEKLQKEDIAFSLTGCQGVEFIEKYTNNKNILIYNEISTSYE